MESEVSSSISKEPAQMPCVIFRNKLDFQGKELLASHPTPQDGGPALIGCSRLLIKYIHSYPPYLEAAFPIRIPWARRAVVTGTT
jgi:hypothetical protein